MSDNPTSGQILTHRSESSPAPQIAGCRIPCSPLIRAFTQPLTDVVQDAEQGPEAIQSNGLRMVSAPPTPTGQGPARSAQETLGRTLPLLRSERQPSKSGPSGSRHATGLAQMAAPSQPAHASHVGAVQPTVGTLPASPPAGCRADMGGVATRHISGGAGWWKSPCPDLVRASGEQSPGATRPGCRWRPVEGT